MLISIKQFSICPTTGAGAQLVLGLGVYKFTSLGGVFFLCEVEKVTLGALGIYSLSTIKMSNVQSAFVVTLDLTSVLTYIGTFVNRK